MNLKSTLLALGLVIPASVFSTDYYITNGGAGDKSGTSWDNAMAFETFYTNFQDNNNYDDGDAFYFAEGTYVVPRVSVATQIAKAFTFKGGYPEALTGTELPDVDYSTHRTIISGDRNNDGIQNVGDARCLFALQANTTSTTNPQKPILIQGFDFCYVYTAEPTNDNSSRKGALCIDNSGDVTIKNCRFYNNELTADDSNIGGAALFCYRSTVHLIDCEFTNNKAKSRGAAIRVASNSNTKGHLTIERCLFAGNEVTKDHGSAIFVQYSPMVSIINSAIVDNKGSEAVYIGKPDDHKRVLNIISSTIANNTGGNQIKMVKGNIVNSIIVGSDYDNTENASKNKENYDAIAIVDDATVAEIVSGGYNMLGTCPNGFTAKGSDLTNLAGDNYVKYFDGADFIEGIYNGKIPNGASLTELKEVVNNWGIIENVGWGEDMNNTPRGLTVPGAVKADALTGTLNVGNSKVATYYNNVYGYTMPKGLTGYIVTTESGNKVMTDAAYAENTYVPKGAALILAGDTKEYEVAFKLSDTTEEYNLLCGTQEEKEIKAEGDELLYKLADDGGIGFFWDSDDGKTLKNGANKCYLKLDKATAAGAKGFYLNDMITGISYVDAGKVADNGVCYTLSGVRVAKPKSGIYIKNGKKIIVK